MRNPITITVQPAHDEEPDIEAMFNAMAKRAAQKAAEDQEEPDIEAMFAAMAEQAARKA